MSDRIDELVRVAQGTFCWAQGSITFDNSNDYNAELDALVANREGFNTALTELATIAREADKWRKAAEWLTRSAVSCLGTSDCDVFFDEDNPDRERICDECRQSKLDRALAAVEKEEAE